MEKLLDSDWLRAMQFKCNASAKSATPVTKILYGNSECEKSGFKKHPPALFPRKFLKFVLLISNHTVSLVQI